MNQIYRQLEATKKELPLFYTFGIAAFLAGLFLSTFDILVHANFLEVFGYKYLSLSYIIAGSVGVLLTFLYSRLFRKALTKSLNREITTLILICTGSYLITSILVPSVLNTYIGMVLLFPVNILIILTLWRFSRTMLSPRQSKEITQKINFFHLTGLALGGALTTGSLYVFNSFTFISILSFSVLFLYWLFQIFLFRIHSRVSHLNSVNEKYVPVSNNLFLFFTSPIAANLYLYTLLSAIVAFSIHFTFINIAAAGFQNVIGLSKFYGLFTAVLVIFIFGVEKFLIKKILYTYDSPYSLVLIPFILLITITITISGYLFMSNYEPISNFTTFFLMLSIAKVAIDSTTAIIQKPSMRALYQTLDIRYRQVVYPRIEGTAIMLGLLISGLVILPITFLKFFTLNLVMYWIGAVSIAWVFIGIRLIKLYKKEQLKALEKLRYNKIPGIISEASFNEKLWRTLTGNDIVKIEHLLNILSDINPIVYEDYLARLIDHHMVEVKDLIVKRIATERISNLIPALQKRTNESNSKEKGLLLQVIDDLKHAEIENKTIEQLRDILFTGDVYERLELAVSLSNNKVEEAEHLLFELIKDVEPVVQTAALKSLANIDKTRFNYILLDFLYPEKYNPYIIKIIASSGEDAIDYLEREQMLSETPDIVRVRTIKTMGRITNERAIDNIISNLTEQDRYIQLQSLQTLIDNQIQANNKNRYKLLNLVVKQISIITQNLSYYRYLHKIPKLKLLTEAYRQEIDFNYDLLFKFLSVIYNPHIIAALKNKVLDGSRSEVNHAIELADQYFDEDIKYALFPLIEDITINDRLKRLEYYFIQPKIRTKHIIRTSLTHDYKTMSLYPRALAMKHILDNNLMEYENELVFNAYHKETLLSETAVYVLSKLHPNALKNILEEETQNKTLERLIISVEMLNEEDLLLNRFTRLKSYPTFNIFSEHVALELAQHARKFDLKKGECFSISELWKKESLFLTSTPVFKGDNNFVISGYNNFADIDLLISYGITELIPKNDTEIWLFPSNIIKELLYDHVSFTDIYFNVIENISISLINE